MVCVLLTPAFFSMGIPRASATEFTISPAQDATIVEHVGVDTLIQADDIYLDVFKNASFDERAVLEFSLATIPSGSTIVSAGLRLRAASNLGNPGNIPYFELHGYVGDGSISVSDAQNDDRLLHAFSDTLVVFKDRTFDVTPFIQETFAAGAPHVGFLVMALPSGVGGVGFASTEYSNTSWYPYLRVVTTAVAVELSTWGRIKAFYARR
jgi:hypothetical protein